MQPTAHRSTEGVYQQRKIKRRNTRESAEPRGKQSVPATHIVCLAEHDLGRTIPPIHDVIGHEPRRQPRVVEPACQSEIANLKLAVRVHEQVARLEVAMHHIGRVDVFQTTENLVDERLEVRVREGLAGTDLEVG